jgi:DNA ligase (NAD+)
MDPSYLDQDFPLIEADPEDFCQLYDIETLENYRDRACDLYYNSDDPEHQGLTDYAYDCLSYWVTKMRKQEHSAIARIGALPRIRNRTKLPHPMPSLDKVKLGQDLEHYLTRGGGGGGGGGGSEIVYSLKLDGISAMITYQDGCPQKCYLRGDGATGQDVTYVLNHIKVPQLKTNQKMVVRGELIVPKECWISMFGMGSKATARNWVSGLLNSNVISPHLDKIHFVAYELVSLEDLAPPKPSESLQILEQNGFEVVKHGILSPCLSAEVLFLYKNHVDTHTYLIDGIVLTINQVHPLTNVLRNPETSVAFKINLQNQMRDTVVTGVDWHFTRHGRLVPVVEMRPVYIDGSRIIHAFAFNASWCLKKQKIGLGTRIRVTRSGGVIPTIVEVLEPLGEPCAPKVAYPWHWSGLDILLDDPDCCPEVMLQRHVHFFETLRVVGIREGMIKRMMESGLTTIEEIISASQERLRQISGIGPKKSESYVNGIKQGLREAQLYRLMLASGAFPTGIGKTILRQVTNYKSCTPNDLLHLPGIGKVRAQKIYDGLGQFTAFLMRTNIDLTQIGGKLDQTLKGQVFVLTGFEDDDTIEDYIIDHGGVIAPVVTQGVTTAVISNNIQLMSEKQMEAYRVGIKVYTASEFKNFIFSKPVI